MERPLTCSKDSVDCHQSMEGEGDGGERKKQLCYMATKVPEQICDIAVIETLTTIETYSRLVVSHLPSSESSLAM